MVDHWNSKHNGTEGLTRCDVTEGFSWCDAKEGFS